MHCDWLQKVTGHETMCQGLRETACQPQHKLFIFWGGGVAISINVRQQFTAVKTRSSNFVQHMCHQGGEGDGGIGIKGVGGGGGGGRGRGG